ncbi:hypothetical protein [Paenibacillus bouchesdurhonensis]|uniref:hypothetical protein n=1 Tax=Paenibacillus bouchesdurhonensis TaxID=1870990 RepID=UPI000DA62FC1|nr:hypothetical protein [Paenibacillus bouchesdurhonensis]
MNNIFNLNDKEIQDLIDNNIGEEQIFKNYKELCRTMHIFPAEGGKNTRLQQDELRRFIDWEKVEGGGNKIRIIKKYSKPEKYNGKPIGRKKAEYLVFIKQLLIVLLVKNNGRLIKRKSELSEELSLINKNYGFCKKRHEKFSTYLGVDMMNANEVFNSVDDMIENNVSNVLNQMEKEELIKKQELFYVCVVEQPFVEINELGKIKYDKPEIIVDEYGEEHYKHSIKRKGSETHRQATSEEIKLITDTEMKLLEEYKCKNKSEIRIKGKKKDFDKRLGDTLFNRANIRYSYKVFDVYTNELAIIERWNRLNPENKLSLEDQAMLEEMLNKSVINQARKNAVNRHNNALKEPDRQRKRQEQQKKLRTTFGGKYIKPKHSKPMKPEVQARRADKKYVYEQHTIIDAVMKKDAPNIRKAVLQTMIN